MCGLVGDPSYYICRKLKEAAYQTIVANKDKQIQHLENQLSRATTGTSLRMLNDGWSV